MNNLSEEVTFHGHPLIVATHRTTFEVTKEAEITRRADCVIGVKADKACTDLDPHLRQLLRRDERVKLKLAVDSLSCEIWGRSSPGLTLRSTVDLVVRKSNYTCHRTLAINCDLAAADLPRIMIQRLKNPDTIGTLTISI